MHGKTQLLVALGVFTLFHAIASAQVDRATVTGRVTDATDAVIPGAMVTVRNTQTNVSAQTTTDEQGSFVIGGLIPGPYDLSVELAGFQKAQRAVILEVGQRARVDFTLTVG